MIKYHPGYFLLYGYFRDITWSKYNDTLGEGLELGKDIEDDMILESKVPQWTKNLEGNAFVPNLGNIKMKPPDWSKWWSHTFQTCLWLGTATPSKKSQQQWRESRDYWKSWE